MFIVELSILINRSPKEVFNFASDPSNAHKWQGNIISKRWTSEGPYGVGSTQRVVSQFLGREMEVTNEYNIWEPGSQVGFKTIDSPIQIEEKMRFEPVENKTKVIFLLKMRTGGILKLLDGWLKKQAVTQSQTNLGALKNLLEQSPG